MARTIKTLSKSALPGTGFNTSGTAKQGKRRVVGTIAVTSLASGEGVSLTAADLGLSAIDYIAMKHTDEAAGMEGRGGRFVRYCNSTSDFYIVQEIGTSVQPATGATHTVTFEAFGDSADDVELT